MYMQIYYNQISPEPGRIGRPQNNWRPDFNWYSINDI